MPIVATTTAPQTQTQALIQTAPATTAATTPVDPSTSADDVTFAIAILQANSSTGQLVLSFAVTNNTPTALNLTGVSGQVWFDAPAQPGNPYTKSTPGGFPSDGNTPGFVGNASAVGNWVVSPGQTTAITMNAQAGVGPEGTGTAPHNAEAYPLANLTLLLKSNPGNTGITYPLEFTGTVTIDGINNTITTILNI
jgi:hypothetical protein